MALNATVAAVTERIVERSRPRADVPILDPHGPQARERGISPRPPQSAAISRMALPRAGEDKPAIRRRPPPNIAIVTAYNDMLSAHQPYGRYPERSRFTRAKLGATAQVAGGVAAMCDGVTQGQPGMDLSLFSRDTIALSTAVALSHGMFEGVAMLGHLRQDRPRPADRRAALRPSAGAADPRRADAVGPRQQGEAARPPIVRRRQGRQGGTARRRGRLLSRAGHLHFLRHRQFEPDDDGADGAAHPRRGVHQSGHAAAAGADPGGATALASAGAGDGNRRRRRASTSARSSTPRSGCSRPAARPTMRSTSPRSPARPGSCSTGRISTNCRRRCR